LFRGFDAGITNYRERITVIAGIIAINNRRKKKRMWGIKERYNTIHSAVP
jgi:hypothetical protein